MPLVGLRTEDGSARKRFEEIDLSDLRWIYPATPSIVAMVMEDAKSRADVDPNEVSASQFEKSARQMWLETTSEFFETVTGRMGAMMGTIKHAMVNPERPGFIMETRVPGPYGSAKNDSFHIASGVLEDLKNVKWYKAKMILTGGVMKEAIGYAMQMNLWRVLAKTDEGFAAIQAKYPDVKHEDINVKKMILTLAPPDLDAPKRKEAEKLIASPELIPYEVPMIEDKEVIQAYGEVYDKKQRALDNDYAPLCTPEERWERNGFPVRCAKYCPVVEECQKVSELLGEEHPLRKKTRRAA
jgi:hypothetical protein